RWGRTRGGLGCGEGSEAVHAAVGAGDGTIGIWQNYRHHAGHRVSTDIFRAERGVSATDQVPLVSLDRFVRDRGLAGAVRFIKVDVEGYESAVCEGMKETLRASPDVSRAMESAPV